jgi:hypothetical protein
VFWIRNTTRNVTTVVAVFTTSCQVSEKWNRGPLASHTITPRGASANAHGVPITAATR